MKITLCGSISFIEEMIAVAKQLETLGHAVKLPPTTEPGENGEPIPLHEYHRIKKGFAHDHSHWIWRNHDRPIRDHFEKIEWCDAILVLNMEKNSVPGYIGGNTLVEMGLAMYLRKPIYLLNPVPQMQYTEEVLGMKPIVLNQNLSLITV